MSNRGKREWLVIEPSTNGAVFHEQKPPTGYIPRTAVTAMGIRTKRGGCDWFTSEEMDRMRAHPEWRNTLP